MPGPRVSCIVVAFHRPASLERLLNGISHTEVEVVVANVGDDPSVRAVAAESTRVIGVAGNPGYAAAVNRAVLEVSADVVVFMNDDVVIDATTLLALAAEVTEGRTDVAVPRLLTPTAGT